MLVMVVALLVFGPEKLPEMARNLGRTASQLRRMAQDMKDDFSTALDDDEEDRPAPGSGSTRPRAAGALPGGDDGSSADSAGEANEPTFGHDSADDATSDDSDAGEEGDDRPTLQDATADAPAADEEVNKSSSIQASARGGSEATSGDDVGSSIASSAGGGSGPEAEDDESASIKGDLERLNRQQRDAEAAAVPHTGDSKIEGRE